MHEELRRGRGGGVEGTGWDGGLTRRPLQVWLQAKQAKLEVASIQWKRC